MLIGRGVNLVMPMGGQGSRFNRSPFDRPKPLIEIETKPFFHWATESIRLFVPLATLTFVVLREHVERFQIDHVIHSFYPDARLVVLEKVLPGAVLTCLEGAREIQNDCPVVFNDCDHIFYSKRFNEFLSNPVAESSVEGALLSFFSNDPKFSFLRHDQMGNVVETVEKIAASHHAICGAYYFSNRHVFEKAAAAYLKECSYAEFFMSGVYNSLFNQGGRITSFNVDFHLPFGTPDEYSAAVGSALFQVLVP